MEAFWECSGAWTLIFSGGRVAVAWAATLDAWGMRIQPCSPKRAWRGTEEDDPSFAAFGIQNIILDC